MGPSLGCPVPQLLPLYQVLLCPVSTRGLGPTTSWPSTAQGEKGADPAPTGSSASRLLGGISPNPGGQTGGHWKNAPSGEGELGATGNWEFLLVAPHCTLCF